MFKNVQNMMDKGSVQVCRLCLAAEEDLIHIFNPKGYQGLLLWEIIEELLQMGVSKKDGLPWTICECCIGKVKEFKDFKKTCIEAKISYLSMIANSGLVEPTTTFPKGPNSRTSRMNGDEVEVVMKKETPVVSKDEDPLREVSFVIREESHGGKMKVKDEMETDISLPDAETCDKVNLFRDEFTCTGVSSDAALSDPLDLIGVKQDADANGSLLETVTSNQENVEHIESLGVGPFNVVCLPLEMGECPTEEGENEPRESLAGEETHERDKPVEEYSRLTSVTNVVSVPQALGDMFNVKEEVNADESLSEAETHDQEIYRKVESTCMGVSNDASLADPLDLIDIKDDAAVVELCSEANNQENHQEYISLDIQFSNVLRLPLVQENLAKVKEEVTSSESLSEAENNRSEENPHESESSNDDVSSVVSSPLQMEDLIDGCSMAEGSTKMCEEVVRHSLRTVKMCIAKKEESLKSDDYINSALKLNDRMPSEQRHLDSHKRKLAGCTAFICDQCGVKYTDKKKLLTHVRGHISRNRPSTSVMPSLKCIQSRVTRNQSSKQFKCEICGKEFKFKSSLTEHFVVHSNLKPFKCETCGNVFKRKNALLGHSKIHLHSKPFKCDCCGKGFSLMSGLASHLVIHSGLRPFKCKTCGKGYARKSHLHAHLLKHSDLRPFKCDACRRGFKRKIDLCRHLVIHSVFRHFMCDTCGKGFSRKSNLVRHSVTHKSLRPYKCDTCRKGFARKCGLVEHLVIHSGLRPHKCDTCGKAFTQKSILIKHSVVHSGLRPFKCEICGKGFARKSNLVDHLGIHSGLTPFKCEPCGKDFKRKKDLYNHLVIHSGLRPFRCDICGRGFSRKNHLDGHSVMHSSLRPFKCDTCGKEFKWRSGLRRHSIIHS